MTGLLEKVAEVYKWLDSQKRDCEDLAGECKGCGNCCDFDTFGHLLFVTPPELMYLVANLRTDKVKPMLGGTCPYSVRGKCTIYPYRFAGCRVFCCGGDVDFQSTLSESALRKFKSLCTEYRIPYRYTSLAAALSDLAAV